MTKPDMKVLWTIIREIMIREGYRSPRQVFEHHADINQRYHDALVNDGKHKAHTKDPESGRSDNKQ